jgi:hypothetical protein
LLAISNAAKFAQSLPKTAKICRSSRNFEIPPKI